jgi:type IV fimbrial biogenesis protein FimT
MHAESIITSRRMVLSRQRGFSLIEMMIVVTISFILFAFAAPLFGEYTTNTRVRAAAEALQADLVLARTEALKRNRPVSLLYGPTNAIVQTTDPNTGALIEVRNRELAEEGGVDFVSSNAIPSTGIAFDALGRASAGALTITMQKTSKGTCESAGGKVRCMSVQLTAGGTSRMCDPKLDYVQNTRGCLP